MNAEPEVAAGRQLAAAPARAERLRRQQMHVWALLGLIPLSVLIALLVLHVMAASAAAATGGCGGG